VSCVVPCAHAGLTRAEHSAHGVAVLLLSVAARALDPRHPRMLTRCCACVAKSLARPDTAGGDACIFASLRLRVLVACGPRVALRARLITPRRVCHRHRPPFGVGGERVRSSGPLVRRRLVVFACSRRRPRSFPLVRSLCWRSRLLPLPAAPDAVAFSAALPWHSATRVLSHFSFSHFGFLLSPCGPYFVACDGGSFG
jgi:hypothetical protein